MKKLLSMLLIVIVVGCTTTKYYDKKVPYTEKVPVKKTRQEPYVDTKIEFIDVPYTVTHEIERYRRVKPRFPLREDKIRLAIMPFQDSSGDAKTPWGKSVSEALEHYILQRLMNKELAILEENDIREKINEDKLENETDKDRWWITTGGKYQLLDRRSIEMLMEERSLKKEVTVSPSEIKNKTRSVLEADALITGYVDYFNGKEVLFTIKATDMGTSEIVFSGRYRGDSEIAIQRAAKDFFYDVEYLGTDVINENKTRTEKVERKVTKYKTVSYTDYETTNKYKTVTKSYEEIDWLKTITWYVCMPIIILGLILGAGN